MATLMLVLAEAFAVVFVLAVVGFIVAIIVWGVKHEKTVRENWMTFARYNGLRYDGNRRTGMAGVTQNVPVQIHTYTQGSGKNSSTYTKFSANVTTPVPAGLHLYRETMFSKLSKAMGGQDIQVGDKHLDDNFIIRAADVIGVRTLLGVPQVRAALLQMIAKRPTMEVKDSSITWSHHGVVHKPEDLSMHLRDLIYMVRVFDDAYYSLVGAQAPAAVQTVPERRTTASARTRAVAAARRSTQQPEPIVRQAGTAEVLQPPPFVAPAAAAGVASAFAALGDKMQQTGAARAEDAGRTVSESRRTETTDNGVFITEERTVTHEFRSDITESKAFEDAHLNDEMERSARSGADAMKKYDPNRALDDHPVAAYDDQGDAEAFQDPKPVIDLEAAAPTGPPAKMQDADQAATPEGQAASLEALIGMFSDRGVMSGRRRELIEQHAGRAWPVEVTVERIDRTFGFDLPNELRDGRTVEGALADGTKVHVRFAPARNDEISALKRGNKLNCRATVAAWDDLFKRATLNAV